MRDKAIAREVTCAPRTRADGMRLRGPERSKVFPGPPTCDVHDHFFGRCFLVIGP